MRPGHPLLHQAEPMTVSLSKPLIVKLVANPKPANHFGPKVDPVPNYAMSFQPQCGYSVLNTSNQWHVESDSACSGWSLLFSFLTMYRQQIT